MHVRTYSLTLFVSARDKLNKRANSHLLPVLLQRRHRGEVARVVHQLKFLKNTVIRQHVHVDARKQESKLLWSSDVIVFFLSPLPNAQECFKSSAKCTLKAHGFSNANALCKKRKREKIKKFLSLNCNPRELSDPQPGSGMQTRWHESSTYFRIAELLCLFCAINSR